MFKKFADGFQSTLAQAGEQAKTRNTLGVPPSSSPRNSSSAERPNATNSVHVPYEEGNLDSDNEEVNGNKEKSGDGSDAVSVPRPSTSSELPPAIQKRLNKLAKYELKYPELLKAYRALQVVDGYVKPFEKALGDITPAASIQDVEAFQQWAHNFTLKTQMSMDELRRVSQDLETLQQENKTLKEGHAVEVAGLKQQISDSADVQAKESSSEPDPRQIEDLQAEIKRLHDISDEFTEQKQAYEQEIRTRKEVSEESRQRAESAEKSSRRAKEEVETVRSEAMSAQELLRAEIIDLKVLHTQELRKIQANQAVPTPSVKPSTPSDSVTLAEGLKEDEGPNIGTPLSKGQKKRQKKKKAGGKNNDETETSTFADVKEPTEDGSGDAESHEQIRILTKERDDLQLELDTLRATSDLYSTEKSSHEDKIRKLTEHQESIEELRDMVKDVGNELVEARDQVKALVSEKESLKTQLNTLNSSLEESKNEKADLLSKLSILESTVQSDGELQAVEQARNTLQAKLDETEDKLKAVTKDLEIAEKLSADRFRDLSTAKDGLRLTASELNELKKSHQKLTVDKASVDVSVKSLDARSRALERAEKDRRDELTAAQKSLAAREKEIKVIQATFKEEEVRRKSEETRASSLKLEVTKLTTLRDSIISSRNDLNGQLTSVRAQLEDANSKLAALQQIRNKLTQERDAAQEELQMGQAKFDSSQSLMESQREQTIDMQHRLREMRDRYEAMEEELSESQRSLTERAREAETLRRLLSEIEGSQESRLREMRQRMESAIAERDKAEDEAAYNGKKRAREVEDLKEKLIDMERTSRKASLEKQDLQISFENLQRASESARALHEAKDRDVSELRGTMSELSHSLREAESQISSLEQDRITLRSALKDCTTKLDRLNADVVAKDDLLLKLREERAQMLDRQTDPNSHIISPTGGRRFPHPRNDSTTSIPSTPTHARSPSMYSVALSDHRPIEKAEVDREYIKNVLFQFFEHKEKRKYLMPAISKLLLLSKQQEGIFVSSLK